MQKREAAFQTRFGRWIKYNWNENSLFELKYCRGNALPFSAVKAHQTQNLLNAKHRKIFWKFQDWTFNQTPADCFSLAKASGYVVIQYASKKRPNTTFFLVDIDDFYRESRQSKRKSLTMERAREIGRECQLGVVD